MIKKFDFGFLQTFPDAGGSCPRVRNLFREHPSRTLTEKNKFFSNELKLVAPDALSWWKD